MKTAELVPTSQWVYNLYEVKFYDRDPAQGGRLLATDYLATATDNHLELDCNRRCGEISCAEFYTWETIRENVYHPRVVGNLYNLNVYEDGWSHGRRLKGISR